MTNMVDFIEIFNSISGEVSPHKQGCLTTFVRLAGCNLKCWYCDTDMSTSYPTQLGTFLSLISAEYKKTGHICLTGGEPLLQIIAVNEILDVFNNVWIETNGTIDFSELIGKAGIVADLKFPEESIPLYFTKLKETDFVKFVISNIDDFHKCMVAQRGLQIMGCQATFAYSPVNSENSNMTAKKLFTWLESELLPKTIINIQIHKYVEMK